MLTLADGFSFYTQGEKVIAVAAMQKDPLPMQCAELMRRDLMPRYVAILSSQFQDLEMLSGI